METTKKHIITDDIIDRGEKRQNNPIPQYTNFYLDTPKNLLEDC